MKITFLGTGTSVGVPAIGCNCRTCRSTDPHDKRLRCSALVETGQTRLLIDAGPDFRQQMLAQPFRRIDAVLLTHIHYDHVGGLDDLRPFCQFGEINVYADNITADGLMKTVPYCFAENRYPGVPAIQLHRLAPHQPIVVGDLTVTPFTVWHGRLPITAYSIKETPSPNNNLSPSLSQGEGASLFPLEWSGGVLPTLIYITDMKTIDEEESAFVHEAFTSGQPSSSLLVVNALRFEGVHYSHQLVPDAIEFARRVEAPRTLLVHSCHDIGLHAEVNAQLPPDIQLAYDGQVVTL